MYYYIATCIRTESMRWHNCTAVLSTVQVPDSPLRNIFIPLPQASRLAKADTMATPARSNPPHNAGVCRSLHRATFGLHYACIIPTTVTHVNVYDFKFYCTIVTQPQAENFLLHI